jgi:hypothetical protein
MLLLCGLVINQCLQVLLADLKALELLGVPQDKVLGI